jgi:SAM-dependent methyltransferase
MLTVHECLVNRTDSRLALRSVTNMFTDTAENTIPMNWKLLYLRSLALSALPFQRQLRALKRRITGVSGDPVNEPGCVADGLRLVESLRSQIPGATVLELGSGWQPLIPLLFKQAGAARVIMTDEQALMDEQYFERARATLAKHGHAVTARWQDFEYRAPCDWSAIPDASVDVIWSRAVLEHVRPADIMTLFAHFRRILRPGGVMAHVIDNSDHWEHKDSSISRANFLKFEDGLWNIINAHRLAYQNRLRHYEYRDMIKAAGFDIRDENGQFCARTKAALAEMKLCRRYHDVPIDDLAVIMSWFVATPTDRGAERMQAAIA